MNPAPQDPRTASLRALSLPCACANLRKAARVATQFYDSILRPSGTRLAQFTLLQALNCAPGLSQKDLAELLGTDSTTLTRTLALPRRKQWIRAEKGTDRRELHFYLTAVGQREYKRVLPYWESAQKGLKNALGKENWAELMSLTARAAGLTPEV